MNPRIPVLAICLVAGPGCRVAPDLGGLNPGSTTGGSGSDDTAVGDEGTGGDSGSGSGTGEDDTSTGTDDTAFSTDDTGDPPRRRPNMLLVIADDFGLDLAGFDTASPCYEYGDVSSHPVMPQVAELCTTGLRFETAWSQPTCSPTRASMMLGQSPFQHGIGAPVNPEVPNTDFDLTGFTLPRAMSLANSGYALASFGKWHVSQGPEDPNLAGWSTFAGAIDGTLDSYTSWERVENGVMETCEDYATTRNVDDTIGWLDTLEPETPWLVWLAFNAPHDPFEVPPEGMYTNTELAEYADETSARPWVVAMSEAMDVELGRLLDQIKARGEWDDTLVIFVGDNGTDKHATLTPVTSTRAKGTIYRGGVQVPLVIGGGAVVDGGRTVSAMVQLSDLHATLLELAGVDGESLRAAEAPEAAYDSISFAPWITAPATATPARSRLLAQAFPNADPDPLNMRHTWTDGRWKIACRAGATQLYDLSVDPWEGSDLLDTEAPDPAVLSVMNSFREELEAFMGVEGLCPYDDEAVDSEASE